jgi:hypothetical protein
VTEEVLMHKCAYWKLRLVVLMMALGTATAQQRPEQAPRVPAEAGEARAFGTISSVGVDRFEIKKMDGSSQTILVDEQTKYQQGQQAIQLEDLKAGDRVAIRGRTNPNKEFVALMVRRLTEQESQRFQNPGERVFGEIVSIENGQIKVQNPRQGERTIVVNEQTEFVKDGQPITLKDLKVGDRIFALGKETQGQFVARRVTTGQFRRQARERPQREP